MTYLDYYYEFGLLSECCDFPVVMVETDEEDDGVEVQYAFCSNCHHNSDFYDKANPVQRSSNPEYQG